MTTTSETHAARSAIGLFADPLRLRIVRLLAAEQMCTCHLTAATGARQPTVSHHLKVLRQAGLIDTEPRGRFTYYGLRPTALEALAAQISDLADCARRARGRHRPC